LIGNLSLNQLCEQGERFLPPILAQMTPPSLSITPKSAQPPPLKIDRCRALRADEQLLSSIHVSSVDPAF
jgi:hypothetical protein